MKRSASATGNAQRSRSKAEDSIRDTSADEIFTILQKWGIHTLGQLAALDKEELGARLGPTAVRMWERANGQCNRLLKFVRPPESFEESFEFEHEIETAEPLLFILRRFLEQLTIRLSAIYFVAKELTLQITFANSCSRVSVTRAGLMDLTRQDKPAMGGKQIYQRVFKIPQPTNDVDLLFRMLQTHLENFRSEQPIIAVALNARPNKPAGEQFGLFETTLRNPHQLSETLARLTALVGSARVGTAVMEETHRPDAFRMEPFSWHAAAIPLNRPVGGHRAPLQEKPALRRFRSTGSASVLLDNDKPAHIRSAEIAGKITDQCGPYLISGNWWDEKSWARVEWDVQLENGELLRCHESEGTWNIDAVYD